MTITMESTSGRVRASARFIVPALALLVIAGLGVQARAEAAADSEAERVMLDALQYGSPATPVRLYAGLRHAEAGQYRLAMRELGAEETAAGAFALFRRRFGVALFCAGERDRALVQLRRAVVIDRSAVNVGQLALVTGGLARPTCRGSRAVIGPVARSDQRSAIHLAHRAAELAGADRDARRGWLAVAAELAIRSADRASLDRVATQLAHEFPGEPVSYRYVALGAALDGDRLGVAAALERLRLLGVASPSVDAVIAHARRLSGTATVGDRRVPGRSEAAVGFGVTR